MNHNIEKILHQERRKFAPIHVFFWILTWIAAGAIFLYCNGWKITTSPSNPISDLNSSGSNSMIERFGFLLVDTQSNRLSIRIDDNQNLSKKNVQTSIPYGEHRISLLWDQGELLSFHVDISADKPFFRRNFTLFHPPVELTGSMIETQTQTHTGNITPRSVCDHFDIHQSGAYYQTCKKTPGVWSFGTMSSSGNIVLKNTNKISVLLANGAWYVNGSGTLFFPKNYFITKNYDPLEPEAYPLRSIFSHLWQDFAITHTGSIVGLNQDNFTHLLPDESWIKAQSIGWDLLLVNNSGSIYFFDELYRSRNIENIHISPEDPFFSAHTYEHAYIISTNSGSYLYQPYQDQAEKLSDGIFLSWDEEVLEFILPNKERQYIMLSAINPSSK